MTHEELQARITDLCDRLGLAWHHEQDPRRSRAGWVDLAIFGRATLFPAALFVEIKSEDGRRTREQERWALHIQRAGLDYRLWRPSDWDEDGGIIRRELEGIA